MRRILFGTMAIGLLGIALFAMPMLVAQQSPFPPLPVLQALDKNGDGEVSAEELAAAPAALRSLDKNADGKLEGEEIVPSFGFGHREWLEDQVVLVAPVWWPGFGGPGFGGPGGPGFGGGGFGGPGGPGGGNRALVEQFDKDGDGRLNTEERNAARAGANSGGAFGGGRGPGGPGGRGGPAVLVNHPAPARRLPLNKHQSIRMQISTIHLSSEHSLLILRTPNGRKNYQPSTTPMWMYQPNL